ncbi:MAG TPA: SAM-dependent methyltransferase [Eubacteriaceae bacterium]|nr:SAM-dependent methyltransferase [Eubacteriaceae bacterium]
MLLENIEQYWSKRSDGYSQVNKKELQSISKKKWMRCIENNDERMQRQKLRILDIGTGPGFFSIIAAERGHDVTAVDYCESMLEEAKNNAGNLREKICFCQMDAQQLDFKDRQFDLIVSRNVTWNLQDPQQAYGEWYRVLKKGGILLNFDANWYHHLFDPEKRKKYEEERIRTLKSGVEDHYIGTDIDAMEDIARRLPMSKTDRPSWDMQQLISIGFSKVLIDYRVGEEVWNVEEKINYESTPLFMIKGIK